MAGFVASNHLKGGHPCFCHAAEVQARHPISRWWMCETAPSSDKLGRIPGALHIPLDELRSRLGWLPKDKELLIRLPGVGLRGQPWPAAC